MENKNEKLENLNDFETSEEELARYDAFFQDEELDDDDYEEDNEDVKAEPNIETGESYSTKVLLKLKAATPNVQELYSNFRNELAQFPDGILKHLATSDVLYLKRTKLIIIKVYARFLKVYFALDPNNYDVKRLHHKDVSDKKSYVNNALLMKIKSPRSYKYALELVRDVMNKFELSRKRKKKIDYKMDFSSSTFELMSCYYGNEYFNKSCSLDQSERISDSKARKCILLRPRVKVKKIDRVYGEISIGELSAAFNRNYVVDLKLLKKTKLIDNKVNYLAVTAEGKCYRGIQVVADDYDPAVIRMLAITKGNITKLI